jgi:hypothetical protein
MNPALFGIEEDVGGEALAGELAAMEALAVAELEVHGIGAVADPGHGCRAVEGVVEEGRGLEAEGGLGDHVPGAWYVAGLPLRYSSEVGKGVPVGEADLLEKGQVDGVVDVAVGVEIRVPDLQPRGRGGVFQSGAPFLFAFAARLWARSCARGIVHTRCAAHLI